MNIKRYCIASIAVFVVYVAINFIIHSVILMGTYESLKGIWRPDMMEKMWVMWIVNFVFAFLFTYIFIKGYENRGWMEGVRYGLLIGLLVSGVGSFTEYAVYPLPLTLVIQWFVYGLIQIIICGIVAALIYRSET
jgi:hypothetical protein